LKVKSLLVSQPKPAETEKSPYHDLAKKYNLKIDFRQFIQIDEISAKDFRKKRINIAEHGAVIFNSKNAADHFFRMCTELRISVPETMKYFCLSESIAFYLQKYVIYRKRKIFYGARTITDLLETIKKHKDEKFLLPCSNVHKDEIADVLKKNNIDFTRAVLYKTVTADLSDLAKVNYDVLVFFTPAGIKSLFKNFPKFKQNNTRIAAFGEATAKAIADAKLRLDIKAPTPAAPSMTMALEAYIKKANK